MREGLHRGFLNDADSDAGISGSTKGYRDIDEWHILTRFGSPASTSVTRAVTAVVMRYYSHARAEDGRGACSMLLPSVVKAVPIDHGQFGPSYLHHAKTCAEVMTGLFRHRHRELAAPVAVTRVLVNGGIAYALLGSTRMPAGHFAVQRTGGRWWVLSVLGSPIS